MSEKRLDYKLDKPFVSGTFTNRFGSSIARATAEQLRFEKPTYGPDAIQSFALLWPAFRAASTDG